MAKDKSKDSDEDRPEDIPFERELKSTRRRAMRTAKFFHERASGEASAIGFWGVIAGVGIATDLFLLGGVGTALAAFSGIQWANYKDDERKTKKEIEALDRKIMEIERLRTIFPQKPASPQTEMKDDFSKAQKQDVNDLRKKLADLEKELEKMKNPKQGKIDKPKFDGPKA